MSCVVKWDPRHRQLVGVGAEPGGQVWHVRVSGLYVSLATHEEGLLKLSSLLSKADTSQGRRSRKRVMPESQRKRIPKGNSFVADTSSSACWPPGENFYRA